MSILHYTAVAVFHESTQAGHAIRELHQRGFREDQIGLVPPVETGSPQVDEGGVAPATLAAGGAGAGLLAGASLGGLIGGPAAIPGGALVGGLVGGLIGLGVPEEEARYYQRELESGRTIVAVNSDGRYEEAVEVLRRHGGHLDESPLSESGPGALP